MSKLHEALAVEGALKGTAEKLMKEAAAAFKNKEHLYTGYTKTYVPRNEEDNEKIAPDMKNLVSTVPEKLKYLEDAVVNAIDCMYQKEKANTKAKADVVVDGVVLATDVPSLVLLTLETRLKQLREVHNVAPTLDPSLSWKEDDSQEDAYVTEPTCTIRTKKKQKAIVLYDATEHHPAQTQLIAEDVHVGDWNTVHKSGMLSPRRKHEYLKRMDKLIQSVVRARQSANDQELEKVSIGKALFDYIQG